MVKNSADIWDLPTNTGRTSLAETLWIASENNQEIEMVVRAECNKRIPFCNILGTKVLFEGDWMIGRTDVGKNRDGSDLVVR